MARYLSVHWNASEKCPASVALVRNAVATHFPQWRPVLERDGALVFCSPGASADIVRFENHRGVVVGPIFPLPSLVRSEPVSKINHFPLAVSKRILDTRGRTLVSEFWGSYVAILVTPRGEASHVLRSPMAHQKCFYTQFRDLHLTFSSVDDYASLQLTSISINWDCVRAQVACSDYMSRETALKDVLAAEGGECIEISHGGVSRSYYWHPCDIAKDSPIATFDEAKDALRKATDLCVQSWSHHYGRILHRLSGGLDSSISVISASKVLHGPEMTCLNYYSHEVLDDERRFARAVVECTDSELLEIPRDSTVDLTIFNICARTAWPALDFSGYGVYRMEVEIAQQKAATAIFCGELGDNLFENDSGRDAASDYVFRRGFTPGLLNVAIDCALRRDSSIWQVLYRAAHDRVFRDKNSLWSSFGFMERELDLSINDMTLLRPEVLESVRASQQRFAHPWFEKVEGVSPAKFLMIMGMSNFGFYELPFADPDDPPLISPIASQPLAEVCLRTPTYFNNRGARDRAVARAAFADVLPESVLLRATKGTPEPWTRDVVRRNQDFLREYLVDGILVQRGIVDRNRIEHALSNDVGDTRVPISDVIAQLYIEAWLRRWLSTSVRAAA